MTTGVHGVDISPLLIVFNICLKLEGRSNCLEKSFRHYIAIFIVSPKMQNL